MNCPTGAGGRPLVAGRPWASDQWAATSSWGLVARQFPFFLNFFSFLPSTFSASGQFLLVDSSTCPPYLDFSLKLQIPVTFDP
jgi:hypothetical protein